MLFRRKGNKAGQPARQRGGSAKAGGTKSKTAAQGAKTTGRGAAGAPQKGAGQQQSRAQAEAQIKQMMNDGSLDKVKTLMKARNPEDVAEEYPDETVSVIRNWLNDPNR